MKTFSAITLTLLFTSCLDGKIETTRNIPQPTKRIIGKGYIEYEGTGYQIIEIDSIEYIVSTSGGIFPLIKNK